MTLNPTVHTVRLHKPGSSSSGQVASSKGSGAFRSSISPGFCVQIKLGIQNPILRIICVNPFQKLTCWLRADVWCDLQSRRESHTLKYRPAGQSQPWHKAPPTHFQTGNPHETTETHSISGSSGLFDIGSDTTPARS